MLHNATSEKMGVVSFREKVKAEARVRDHECFNAKYWNLTAIFLWQTDTVCLAFNVVGA